VISILAAEGPLLDRVIDARCQSPHNGLSSRACRILHAAQMKTTWGRQRQRTFALTDDHEIVASAEQYDLTGMFDGRAVRICAIGPVQSDAHYGSSSTASSTTPKEKAPQLPSSSRTRQSTMKSKRPSNRFGSPM
jgi:hypothetical protein